MSKQHVKIKHLGMFSTGKFLAVFNFILGLVMLLISLLMTLLGAIVSVLFGLGSGDFGVLAFALTGGIMSVLMTFFMALFAIFIYTLIAFFAGIIIAFVFNMVVKISGGLSFDAEIR